jgi:P27 family predicted phage terminase small subunit
MATALTKAGRPGGVTRIKRKADFRMLTEVPPHPEHFNSVEAGLWAEYAGIMIDRGDLSEADLGILETFVSSLADYRRFQKILREEGDFMRNVNGNLVHHPASYRLKGSEGQINLSASALGLSPRGRAGIIKDLSKAQSDVKSSKGSVSF